MVTTVAAELVLPLQDDDDRRVREMLDDLQFPPEDEYEELTDHSGIFMV